MSNDPLANYLFIQQMLLWALQCPKKCAGRKHDKHSLAFSYSGSNLNSLWSAHVHFHHIYLVYLNIMWSLPNYLSSSINNLKMHQLMAFKSRFVIAIVKFPPAPRSPLTYTFFSLLRKNTIYSSRIKNVWLDHNLFLPPSSVCLNASPCFL